jgi:hypothetical protein
MDGPYYQAGDTPWRNLYWHLALGLIDGVLIGYLANAMGLPGWVRTIAVLLCVLGGIMLSGCA